MEPNEDQFGSFYHQQQQVHSHHQQHHQQPSATATTTTTNSITPSITASPTNGLIPNAEGSHSVYPHSVPSAVSSQEPVKRKRGRPRKYGTPEQALAAKKAAAAATPSSSHSFSSKVKKDHAWAYGSGPSTFTGTYKKSQLSSVGNTGEGFTPHVINVAANEDVGQKIMMFMQQTKREICILSASGSISNASLCQPATSGGSVMYEGLFDIISLSGSYVRCEFEGRTGGLSVCLSSTDGQIIGGGVGGPLKAAGPVQVIVGTFLMETKKDGGVKGDGSVSKLPLQVGGESISNVGFHSLVDPSRAAVRGNEDHQAIGSSHFMIQPESIQVSPGPTDWRGHVDARSTGGYELTGRTGHGACHSPENGDYDQIPE